MLTPDDLRRKLARRYDDWVQAALAGQPFTPLRLPVGSLPDSLPEARAAIALLERDAQRSGYTIEYTARRSRTLGAQNFPTDVHIDTPEILLRVLDKAVEFHALMTDAALIRDALPDLAAWLPNNVRLLQKYHGEWPQIVAVCHALHSEEQPQVFLRELPLGTHTKFIERHESVLRAMLDHLAPNAAARDLAARLGLRIDETLIRGRWLDGQMQQRYGLPLTDMSLPVSQWAALESQGDAVLIVENKATFLSLPALPDTLALWGSGFQAEVLAKVAWLHDAPLLYWGDLDVQGFEILARLRHAFPHVQSLMMDSETLRAFAHFGTTGTPRLIARPTRLTDDEWAVCRGLMGENTRLEQERIAPTTRETRLRAALAGLRD